jgi:hypothetical protein
MVARGRARRPGGSGRAAMLTPAAIVMGANTVCLYYSAVCVACVNRLVFQSVLRCAGRSRVAVMVSHTVAGARSRTLAGQRGPRSTAEACTQGLRVWVQGLGFGALLQLLRQGQRL